MMKLERLAVSCGGTGGHFYPGLSVARELNAAGGRALLILGGKMRPDRRKSPAGSACRRFRWRRCRCRKIL